MIGSFNKTNNKNGLQIESSLTCRVPFRTIKDIPRLVNSEEFLSLKRDAQCYGGYGVSSVPEVAFEQMYEFLHSFFLPFNWTSKDMILCNLTIKQEDSKPISEEKIANLMTRLTSDSFLMNYQKFFLVETDKNKEYTHIKAFINPYNTDTLKKITGKEEMKKLCDKFMEVADKAFKDKKKKLIR